MKGVYRYGMVVEFIYMDRQGRISQRTVFILAHKNEKLIAYCFMKRKVRTFLIENILGMRKVRAA